MSINASRKNPKMAKKPNLNDKAQVFRPKAANFERLDF